MWGFSARRETLGVEGAADEVAGDEASEAVLAQMSDWTPDLRRLVERTEMSSLTSFAVKSSVPIGPWRTGLVTLVGDALHNMTRAARPAASSYIRFVWIMPRAFCIAARHWRQASL